MTGVVQHSLPHPSNLSGPCLRLLPDGRDRWGDCQEHPNYQQLPAQKLLDLISRAGIIGMGGAGFPTSIKLAADKPVHTLIINGVECEPYITADQALMAQRPEGIVAGVEILAHLLQPREILLAIEDNKPLSIEAMRRATAGTGIEVVVVPTLYPSGGERQLIQILTGQEVPSGKLPVDLGITCQNVDTAGSIYRAIVLGQPLISRITTVTGEAVREPGNHEVAIGTPIGELLRRAGFEQQRCRRVIMGGPMMGFALGSLEAPVIKTSNCILAPSESEMPEPGPPRPCIRCGLCSEVCPALLLPQQLYWFSLGPELEKLEAHNLFDCIECGACSYVCPSELPLVQHYRAAKAQIREQREARERGERSRERFEFHQQRMEEQARAKAERRKASRAVSDQERAAIVQEAVVRVQRKREAGQHPVPAGQPASAQAAPPTAAAATTAAATEPKVEPSTPQQQPAAQQPSQTPASQTPATPPPPTPEEVAAVRRQRTERQLARATVKLEGALERGDEELARKLRASIEELEQRLGQLQESRPD